MHKKAQIELMIAVLVVAAMFFAMPQFTWFAVATTYVLSGPYLLARGERIATVPAALKPVGAETSPLHKPAPERGKASVSLVGRLT